MSGASATSCVIRSPRLCGFHQRDEGDQRSNLSPCLLSASDPEFAYARGFYVWSPDSGVLPGVSWNQWRLKHPDVQPGLRQADPHGANLHQFNLDNANLNNANLSEAHLHFAFFSEPNLSRANIRKADLSKASLHRARLSKSLLGFVHAGTSTQSIQSNRVPIFPRFKRTW